MYPASVKLRVPCLQFKEPVGLVRKVASKAVKKVFGLPYQQQGCTACAFALYDGW
jgi:hypothetical protein